ncbi:MAG: CYTH domain-containing protein [Victivallaceae bacterium]|nr:CYTH domain-containing protein [Victivallaceae bacterium]
MPLEIERKFLLASDGWRVAADRGTRMRQGYFETGPESPTVRVRRVGTRGFITVKGRPVGIARSEFEYPVSAADAEAMLAEFCGSRLVDKIRYRIDAGRGMIWEIDEYLEKNAGLFTAEIELPTPDAGFDRPDWLGREVTGDPAFTNGALSRRPWNMRSEEEKR